MNCPNCQNPIVEEKGEKIHCDACGWFEKVGKEWQGCEAPEPSPETLPVPESLSKDEPETKTTAQIREVQNVPRSEPNPADLEPDPAERDPGPAAHEPDPAKTEPEPTHSVKKYLGGLLTVTEVDDED